MDCLLLIDVQNGFVNDETRFVIPRIEQLLSDFAQGPIIATQFVNRGGPFSSILGWDRMKCSPDINLISSVKDRADYIITKDKYTSCTDELNDLLNQKGISCVYLAGIDTDCCVLKTAFDLFEQAIRPVILVDYCASSGGTVFHSSALRVLERNLGASQLYYGQYKTQC